VTGIFTARLLLALSPVSEYLKDNQQLASPLTAYPRRT
jgi:hypothetical protein